MDRRRKNHIASVRQKRDTAPVLAAPPSSARTFGYARVSTEEQVLDMQMTALRDAGITHDCFFVEKVSARIAHRPQFHLLMKSVERGDTIVVYAFNRLSRDLKQLLTLVDEFRAAGIALRSTSEPHINPFTTSGRLLISVTGAVDENEVGRIRDRTRDGMAEKKRQGMYLGRKKIVSDEVAEKMLELRLTGLTGEEVLARFPRLKIKVSTFYARTNELLRAKKKA